MAFKIILSAFLLETIAHRIADTAYPLKPDIFCSVDRFSFVPKLEMKVRATR